MTDNSPPTAPKWKFCRGCKQVKPIDAFHRCKTHGHQNRCKRCRTEATRRLRAADASQG